MPEEQGFEGGVFWIPETELFWNCPEIEEPGKVFLEGVRRITNYEIQIIRNNFASKIIKNVTLSFPMFSGGSIGNIRKKRVNIMGKNGEPCNQSLSELLDWEECGKMVCFIDENSVNAVLIVNNDLISLEFKVF